jgi:hypothetical protein
MTFKLGHGHFVALLGAKAFQVAMLGFIIEHAAERPSGPPDLRHAHVTVVPHPTPDVSLSPHFGLASASPPLIR